MNWSNAIKPLAAAVSLLALALSGCSPGPSSNSDGGDNTESSDAIEPVKNPGRQAPEKDYIENSIEVYEVSAGYQNSLLDGRVPGLTFKIKNKGDRTLERVEVRAVFKDAEGNPISEENYTPVFTGG